MVDSGMDTHLWESIWLAPLVIENRMHIAWKGKQTICIRKYVVSEYMVTCMNIERVTTTVVVTFYAVNALCTQIYEEKCEIWNLLKKV